MMIKKSELTNKGFVDLAFYLVGDLFLKGVMFITLPLLTYFLSPAEYGILSILTTMVTFFYVLFGLNTENSVNNFYMRGRDGFGSFLFSNILFMAIWQFFFSLGMYFFAESISTFFKVSECDVYFVIATCILLSYYNLYMLFLQGAKKSKEFSVVNVSNKLVEISLLILFSWLIHYNKHLSKLFAQISALIIFLPYIFLRLKALCSFDFNVDYIKKSLIFSIPLIPHVLSNAILSQSDRVMINYFLGERETGLYSFAYNLGLSIAVVISAWNSMWQPRFYELIRLRRYEQIEFFINFYAKIISVISVGAILLTGPIVKMFVPHAYADAIVITPIILCSNTLFFQYYTYVNYSFYDGRSTIISLSTFAAAAVNVLLNLILIPEFGAKGAALATLMAFFVLVAIHFYNAKRKTLNNVVGFFFAFRWFIPVFLAMILSVYFS